MEVEVLLLLHGRGRMRCWP